MLDVVQSPETSVNYHTRISEYSSFLALALDGDSGQLHTTTVFINATRRTLDATKMCPIFTKNSVNIAKRKKF